MIRSKEWSVKGNRVASPLVVSIDIGGFISPCSYMTPATALTCFSSSKPKSQATTDAPRLKASYA